MTTKKEKEALESGDYESLDKATLVEEAERRGLTVERGDGEGEPLKEDYVAALSANDGTSTGVSSSRGRATRDNPPAASDATSEGIEGEPKRGPDGWPVDEDGNRLETNAGSPDYADPNTRTVPGNIPQPDNRLPLTGNLARSDRSPIVPRGKTDEQLEEEAEEKEERAVRVRAIRTGEYPVGVLRYRGDEFNYHQPKNDKDEADMDANLPSWLESVKDGGPETKALPASQEVGIPHKADDDLTEEEAEEGKRPKRARA